MKRWFKKVKRLIHNDIEYIRFHMKVLDDRDKSSKMDTIVKGTIFGIIGGIVLTKVILQYLL